MSIPNINHTSGLDPDTVHRLEALAAGLSRGQTLLVARWFLERFDSTALATDRFELKASEHAGAKTGLCILYGTHSGHSASIAKLVAGKAKARGWSVTVNNLSDYPRGNLKRESNVAVIVSTHGEGQPPESATPFFEYLLGQRAPKLERASFAVLALGDKSYAKFCQAGIDLDARLEALGATRVLNRVDLDLDYQDGAEAWAEQLLDTFAPRMTAAVEGAEVAGQPRTDRIDRENPWSAELLARVNLSGRGSTQHYAHLELSLEGSSLTYEPGDAVGVRPENDAWLVEQLIQTLGADVEAPVEVVGEPCSLAFALGRRVEIGTVTASALRKYERRGATGLSLVLRSPEATAAYLHGRDWLDVLHEHPIGIPPRDFVQLLPELASRSYSIASSQSAHPDEVHLLVSRVSYEAHGRRRGGAASTYLAERLQEGSRVSIWIEPNSQFRLPADPSTPIVLIGAGTGIAPFRAFLEARAVAQAPGKNWVIFGNRQFRSDFTYQSEWLKWREQGLLSRMDVGFSRDRTPKRYVTDLLREQGRDLYAWLEQGAHVYLCGDRAKLAVSTDQALMDVVRTHGGRSSEQATTYVTELTASKRYLKDVY